MEKAALERDGSEPLGSQLKTFVVNLWNVIKDSLKNRRLRGLFLESAVHQGNASLTKDYLQPIIRQTVLTLPFLLAWKSESREALLIGIVYFVLYIASSLASRKSQVFSDKYGGHEKSSKILWIIDGFLFGIAAFLLLAGRDTLSIAALALVVIIQNTWRPIMMSRIDTVSDAAVGATILSIDSQAGSLYLVLAAPLIGLAADHWGLWSLAVFGALFSFGFALFKQAGRD